jgi:hypothetical protein
VIRDYIASNNEEPTPFAWTKSDSLGRCCQRISNSGH